MGSEQVGLMLVAVARGTAVRANVLCFKPGVEVRARGIRRQRKRHTGRRSRPLALPYREADCRSDADAQKPEKRAPVLGTTARGDVRAPISGSHVSALEVDGHRGASAS